MNNDKSFGSLVKESRESLGWSQEILAAKSGLSQATISRIEKDLQTNLLAETKNGLLRSLGINVVDVPAPVGHPIPVISWVSAGTFSEPSDLWPAGISGGGEPVYSRHPTGPHAFALRVEGDSMAPRYLPGDIIVVDPEIRCNNGSPCVIWLNGEVSFKLIRETETAFILVAMNDKYPEIMVKKDSKVDFRIIGKVVDLIAKL